MYNECKNNFKKQATNDELSAIQKKHEGHKKDFIIILAKANKCRETIDYIRTNMDECEIPYTINLRAEEVDKFTVKLDRITNEFQELKQNDYEDCGSDTKAGIRRLIDEMISKLAGFEDDKEDFNKF
jgi:dGTP triphosphohydrolase